MVEQPRDEKLDLLGDDAHDQQETSKQSEQTSDQEDTEDDDGDVEDILMMTEDKPEDSSNCHHDVGDHHDQGGDVDEGGQFETSSLLYSYH